jgi:SAM-dependent methyltransferase
VSTAETRAAKSRSDLPRSLNLGCGDDVRPGWHNVDLYYGGADEQLDISEVPWSFPSDHFDRILASHVLEHLELDDQVAVLSECARVLRDGGKLQVHYPLGKNYRADPTHVGPPWEWPTPDYYCGERHWDADTGLEVVSRRVEVWSENPYGMVRTLQQTYIDLKELLYGQGRWCFGHPNTGGEYIVMFEPRTGGERE